MSDDILAVKISPDGRLLALSLLDSTIQARNRHALSSQSDACIAWKIGARFEPSSRLSHVASVEFFSDANLEHELSGRLQEIQPGIHHHGFIMNCLLRLMEPHYTGIKNSTLLSGQIILYPTKLTHLYFIHNLRMACTTLCVSIFPACIRRIANKQITGTERRHSSRTSPAHCNAIQTSCTHYLFSSDGPQ